MQDNSLVSLEGFDYLFELLKSGPSVRELEEIRDSFYTISITWGNWENRDESKKLIRKEAQVLAILEFLKRDSYQRFLEIGSGNGYLTRRLASLGLEGVGVDINTGLIEKCLRTPAKGVEFVEADAFIYRPDFKPDLVLSLHGCGNLGDRVVDLAVENRSNVLFVPCCYGLLNNGKPRSATLSKRTENLNEIFEKARTLESAQQDSHLGLLVKEIYRILANYDRVLRLSERGYKTGFSKMQGNHLRQNHNLMIHGCRN